MLNAAQSGAEVDDLNNHEFPYLLKQLHANPNIDIPLSLLSFPLSPFLKPKNWRWRDMENDWKVLTLLIGANDLCGVCQLADPSSEPDAFETGVTTVLETVRKNERKRRKERKKNKMKEWKWRRIEGINEKLKKERE